MPCRCRARSSPARSCASSAATMRKSSPTCLRGNLQRAGYRGKWSWGQLGEDGAVGYVALSDLEAA
ncbi:hypothetical protein ACFSLT_09715 [Novosphingobium resinovorum]